jgi:predicted phage terminase large subunit-like protein
MTLEQAATELLRRKDATESLIEFTRFTNSSYFPAPHHRRIAEKLEAVERGEIDRLMIFMPPRHGKSELASRRFPAWYLGRNPNRQIIAASYNSDLANDFGREVRNIVASPEYGCLFDTRLRDDSRAADRWNTDGGGAYVAAGVGTAVTGRGAHVLLIDDPLKDREEADSEIRRQRVWDWYTSTAYTRLMPGGAVIVIQTRWHEADLAGRLLENSKTGGDQWEVLDLPALDDDGKALWPDWYDEKTLERIRQAIGARDWSALYQQRPAPEDGDYFKAEWLRSYDVAPDPKTLRVYGGSDYAVTSGGGDFTCHVVVGVDPEGRMYLLDLWRKQASSDEWIEAFCDLVKKWKPIGWAEEQGQIRAGVGPFLDRRSRERAAYVAREQFPTRGDKAVRAQSIRGRMALGGLYVPTRCDWFANLRGELLSFPAGKHDDQVDALGLVGQLLDKMLSGQKPGQPEKPKNPSGYRLHQSAPDVDDWKTAI